MRPPPARTRDADATREALMAAGSALFARHGFDGVTVEAIARQARVNKAMISYYFGGKARLYEAILTSTFREMTGRIEALRKSSRPPVEVLREFVAVFEEIATRRRPSFPALFLREALEGGPHAQAVVPYLRAAISSVVEVIARGVRDGSFRPVDPLLTHLSIVGSLVFFFATAPMRDQILARARLPFAPPTPEAYVRHMQELVARGLARDRPSRRRAGRLPSSARGALARRSRPAARR